MTALLTQCPHCQTSFRVSTAQINAAHGLVRCGSCLGVFSASANEIRIRTPDGYVIEEIDPDDDTEQSVSEHNQDSAAHSFELPDEDLTLPAEVGKDSGDEAPDVIETAWDQTPDTEPADDDETEEYAQQPEEYAEEPEEYADEYHDSGQAEDDDDLFVVAPAATAPPPLTDDDEPLFVTVSPAVARATTPAPVEDEVAASDYDDTGGEIRGNKDQEPSIWHDEPVITLGDMRLDELEPDSDAATDADEYDDEYDDDQPLEEHYREEAEDEPAPEPGSETEDGDEDGPANEYEETPSDPQPDIYRTPAPVTSAGFPASDAEAVTAAPEKRNLHQRLSALTDDEFDPVDDQQLETLDSVPVTINRGSSLRGQLVQSALVLLSVLLMLTLPLPWLYANRDTLAVHPRFSFMAPLTCKLFTCTPATTLDLGSIYSQQLLVRSHPRYQDALEVSFIFHNDSTLPRPFPLVELAFSDLSNTLLANRLFKPQEYLPAELRQLSEMPPQSTVQVTLELQDPGKEAVNYTVRLYPQVP